MSAILESPDLPLPPLRRWPGWLREPLLHFVVIGALLFAADRVLVTRADDPRTIRVDAAVDREAVQVFEASRGRAPNADELAALRRAWLDNEVLYREGIAMQLDRGDTTIRERVIFKALSAIEANLKPPSIDERALRAWFDMQHTKYDEPARFDFQEAVLAAESSEAAVRSFVAALNAGNPGDAKAGLRVFKGRPHENLVQSYGAEFAKALEQSGAGEWHALQGKDGWRAIRLEAVSAPRPASFEALRNVVMQDWNDATMAAQRTAAVRALAQKYTVSSEAASR